MKCGTWHRRRFDIGAFDIHDGEVLEVHTRREAEAAGHHHRLYFSPEVARMLTARTASLFFIRDGKPEIPWPPWWTQDRKHAPPGLPAAWYALVKRIPARVQAQVCRHRR